MTRARWPYALCLAALLLVSACVSVKQNPPEKRYYGLNVVRTGPPRPLPCGPALRIRPFRITPEYSGKGFVYRDAKLRFQSDFYNEFLVNPEPMITAQIEKWLSDAGLFQLVTNAPSKVLPDYFLEGAISSLYGDYREKKQSKAVIEVHFFLIESGKPKANVLLQKRYHQEIPMVEGTADELIEGWNVGLSHILANFEELILGAGLCAPLEVPEPNPAFKNHPEPPGPDPVVRQ